MVEVWVMHTGLPPVALMTHTWVKRVVTLVTRFLTKISSLRVPAITVL